MRGLVGVALEFKLASEVGEDEDSTRGRRDQLAKFPKLWEGDWVRDWNPTNASAWIETSVPVEEA